jgi:tetratricopeptide (TPR) repeat protein
MHTRNRLFRAIVAVLCLATAFSACTRDPNARKQKYMESGRKYYEAGKYHEAGIQFSNALLIDSRDADAHYELAKTLIKLESWSSAYRELARAVDLRPDNLPAQLDMGSMLLGARMAKQAQEKAELVLQKQPGNPDAHMLLANCYNAQNDREKATTEIKKAIELAPGRAPFYINLAIFETTDKNFADAEQNYHKAIQLDPSSLPALESFARFYETQQKWPEAEQQLKRATMVAPKSVDARVELARLYMATNRRAEAEISLAEAKTALSEDPMGYRLLADFYSQTGQVDKALAEFGALHTQHPKDIALTKSYAYLLLTTDRYGEAQNLDAEILKANPRDTDGTIIKGQIFTKQGHADQAMTVLESAVKTDADKPLLHYYFGNALAAAGNSARAEIEWHETLRLQPTFIDAHRKLAQLAQAKGNTEQLAVSADKLIEAVPSSPEGYFFRANAEMARHQFADADKDLQHAIELAPRSPEPYTRMGQLRILQNRTNDAEKLFHQALAIDPSFRDALGALVTVYVNAKDLPKALAAVDTQIGKVPNDSTYWAIKADLLTRANKMDEAEVAAQKAVDLDKDNLPGLVLLARLQSHNGKVDQSIANYQRGLQANPSNIQLLLSLGSLYEHSGQLDKAEESYHKVLQIQPENPLAANNLAFLMLEHGENPDVALTLAQTARSGMPNVPTTADTLGWAYYKKGAYRTAINLLEDAVQKDPNNASFHYHLGLAYSKVDEQAKADAQLQKALQLDPKSTHADEIRKALNTKG